MFFHTSILSTSGPLGQMWLSAHLKRNKLNKRQIQNISIKQYSRVILKPKDGPMALRLSGQLLLGLVRIYSLKVRYLHEECNNSYSKMRLQRSKVYLDAASHGQGNAAAAANQLPAEVNLDDLVMANVVIDPDEDLLHGDLFFVDAPDSKLGMLGVLDGHADASMMLLDDSSRAGISVVRGDQSALNATAAGGLEAVRNSAMIGAGAGEIDDLSLLGGAGSGGADLKFADLLNDPEGLRRGGLGDDDDLMLDFGDLGAVGGGLEEDDMAAAAADVAEADSAMMDLDMGLGGGLEDDDLVQAAQAQEGGPAEDGVKQEAAGAADSSIQDSLELDADLLHGGQQLLDLPLPQDDDDDLLAAAAVVPLSGRKRKRPELPAADEDAEAAERARPPQGRGRGRDASEVMIRVALSPAELRRIPDAKLEKPEASIELGRDFFNEPPAEERSNAWGWGKRARLAAHLTDPELLRTAPERPVAFSRTLMSQADSPAGSAVASILQAASASALGRGFRWQAAGALAAGAVEDDAAEEDGEQQAEEPYDDQLRMAGLEDLDLEAADVLVQDDDMLDDLEVEDAEALLVADDPLMPIEDDLNAFDADAAFDDPLEAKEDLEMSLLHGSDHHQQQPTKGSVLDTVREGSKRQAATSFEKDVLSQFGEHWRAQVFYKLLELKTMGAVDVFQEQPYADIMIRRADGAAAAAVAV